MRKSISLAFVCIILLSSACKKHDVINTPTPASVAQTYIANAGITDSVQKAAVTGFVTALDNASLWSKFVAIYPMMGSTAASAKWNLKNPMDADGAYRLTFYGSPQFGDTGVLFATVHDYADTHLPDKLLAYNNSAISYFSMTQNTTSGYDMGCSDRVNPFNEFAIYHQTDAAEWFGYHALGLVPGITKGLFVISATATDVKRYDNGIVTNSRGSAPVKSYTNLPILIGNVASDTLCGKRVCALATIGYGLSSQDVSNFYQIATNFEAALKRK